MSDNATADAILGLGETIHRSIRSPNPDDNNVVDALYAIATALDRLAQAAEGPWPTALAEAFAKEIGTLQ